LTQPHFTLVAGPPACGVLWEGVASRLAHHGLESRTLDLFAPAPADGSPEAMLSTLLDRLQEDDPSQTILVAHGTAVPLAWRAAARIDLAGLVLANGPVSRVDPVQRAQGKAPSIGPLGNALLHPRIFQRWLWSSAGLRRTVVNPYVMDRDTVVALSGPILETAAHRSALSRFFAGLADWVPEPPPLKVPTLLIWGDHDPLYDSSEADLARVALPHATQETIPGGQHFHPIERPWAMADAMASWNQDRLTTT